VHLFRYLVADDRIVRFLFRSANGTKRANTAINSERMDQFLRGTYVSRILGARFANFHGRRTRITCLLCGTSTDKHAVQGGG